MSSTSLRSQRLLAHDAAQYLLSLSKKQLITSEIDNDTEDGVLFKGDVVLRWESFVNKLCSMSPSNLLALDHETLEAYDQLEVKTGIRIEFIDRQRYFYEFSKMASPFGLIASSKLQILILKLGIDVSENVLDYFIGNLLESKEENNVGAPGSDVWSSRFGSNAGLELNFRAFLGLLFDIMVHNQIQQNGINNGKYGNTSWSLSNFLPLDPDSFPKQTWDAACLVILLYCSFSVPYSIAFVPSPVSGELSPLDYSDIAIDIIFLTDIALSFVTAYDHHGYMVQNMRSIYKHYMRTWFLLDFAGSFPFDLIISAVLAVSGTSSQNLSAMKLIRTLKLSRAFKLMSRLNRLKNRDGYEVLLPLNVRGSNSQNSSIDT